MFTKEYLSRGIQSHTNNLNPSWVAGAKAGISKILSRLRLRDWKEFLESLEYQFKFMMDVLPAEPGTSPEGGSLYESLGGYVSVAGRMTDNGLMFSVPARRQHIIASLFPGMEMYKTGKDVLIPNSELDSFMRLVPLKGPLEDRMVVGT
ncbi:MAG: hypothetical protein ACXAAK_13645 [Candidatus Thorarchaeota archaeon]